jgi:hypothetical protein
MDVYHKENKPYENQINLEAIHLWVNDLRNNAHKQYPFNTRSGLYDGARFRALDILEKGDKEGKCDWSNPFAPYTYLSLYIDWKGIDDLIIDVSRMERKENKIFLEIANYIEWYMRPKTAIHLVV